MSQVPHRLGPSIGVADLDVGGGIGDVEGGYGGCQFDPGGAGGEFDDLAVGVDPLDGEAAELALPAALDHLAVGEDVHGAVADRLGLGAAGVDPAGPVLGDHHNHVRRVDAAVHHVVVWRALLRAQPCALLGVPFPRDVDTRCRGRT